MKDLAEHHALISDLFKWPSSPEEWLPYALSEVQVREFEKNGFVKDIPVLDDRQVEVLREALEEILHLEKDDRKLFYHYSSNESEDISRVLFHALGTWRVSEPFHDALWNPAFVMAAYQLMGKPVTQFHDQLFCKPAKHGGVVAWHQDFSYWTWTQPMNHLTCWIGLDDASEENGCMNYIPGSHRWGLLPRTGLTGDMESVKDVLTPEQKDSMASVVPVVMKKGYASFHHPMTIHGSYENHSDRQRRALVLNVMGQGTRSNMDVIENKEDLENFPVIPQGEPMEGHFYPLLFNPERELGSLQSNVPTISSL